MAIGGGNTTATVTLSANMDPSGVLNAVKTIQGSFNSLKLNPNLTNNIIKEFGNLQRLLEDYRKAMDKPVTSKKDLKNLENLEKAINSSFSTLTNLYSEINNQTIITKVDSSKLDELKAKTKEAQKALQDVFSNIKVGNSNNGLQSIENSIEKAVARSKTLKNSFNEVFSELYKSGDINKFASNIDSIFNNLSTKLKSGKLQPTIDSLLNSFKSLGLIKIDMPLESTAQKLLALKSGFDTLKAAIANGLSGDELKILIDNLDKATEAEQKFHAEALKKGQDNYKEQADYLNRVAEGAEKAAAAQRKFNQQTLDATTQLEQLQSSTQYFFGLRNMLNLLKRGVREAIDTIKQLDAAMTETAVVTKFSVGDMWSKLPEYTANANALGATVQDMYKSTTLYYQQGLNAEQAMGIASETMKMARIAGLDAADATDMMTAALRGFNMELSETSAQHINDVYSNLAAKTASNTEELGNAMQRTASIAANAGMSFEGTASFLAQAIETTREPAENIGTAMKTIIARMQEMKKNPLEIGEVDGEEVDYNKIDAALKSVGISLKKANGDFRDNDEVLLDISKHWDSLSQTQQRYIATTIAGSRQQSRFIAMVGNYERTQELLGYAKDSEGASNEQFGKTLDSLQAKLNKFQNAWKDFLMGIMNDSWTKSIVSGATSVLNIVNKLIDTLSFGNKGIKSVLALYTAFKALKMAGLGANMLIGGVGGMMSPGSSFKEGFLGGASGLASKGTNKIVKAIYDLVPHIDKAAANDQYKYTGFGDYKKAQTELARQVLPNKQKVGKNTYTQSGNNYSIAGVNAVFDQNKLNKDQQKALLKSMPGLKKNMTKNLAKIMQEAGTDSKVAKGLIAGFKKGEITSEQVLQKSGILTNYTDALKNRAAEGGEKAAEAYAKAQRQTLSREERQNILNQGKAEGKKGQALQQYYREKTNEKLQAKGNIYTKNDQVDKALKAAHELSKSEAAANTLNSIGSAATSAGMSLQMLGSQIATTNPIIGEAITQLGGLVMMLGSIPNAIAGIVAGGPVVWGLAAAMTVLGGIYATFTIHSKKLSKAAEEIQKSFTDINKETEKNIATLKQYQQQAGQWAKGVDSYGNNISLSDDEYSQYLNAVDEIAKINPSIVEGYNAQGHAIININKALSETLALEKQRQEKAFDEYLDPASLDKLVKARNVDSNYLKSTTTVNTAGKIDAAIASGIVPFVSYDTMMNVETWLAKQANAKLGIDLFVKNAAPFTDEVNKVVDNLQKDLDTKDLSEFLSPFGIDWEKLSQDDAGEIQKFVQRRNDIYSAAMKASKGELSKDFTEAFTNLDDNSKEFSESIDNTLQWLRTYVSQSDAFAELPEELKQGINKGLENIAMQPDLNADEMIGQADTLVQNFEKLINSNSKYTEALKLVEKEQDKFATTVNETEYKANIQPAINDLIHLKEEALEKGTTYGDALAEYLENQIQRISNFTKEGGANLSEALNTATDEIATAEGALENFNNATKTDYSTAAEGMKGIFDKTTETFKNSSGAEIQKHAEGMGDATFWTGAEALLSGKELEKLTKGKDGYEAAEAVSKKIQDLEPMLREGQEGFDAFTDRVLENADAMDKLAEAGVTYDKESGLITNIPDDQWHNVAEALGISDELLTSMINKGRQFANISFMNVDDARKALAASDYTIKGTQAKEGEQQNLYVKEDTLRTELANAGYVRKEQQDEQIAKLLDSGVKTIPADATQLNPKDLDSMAKDWGVNTLPDLIQKLNDTGDFTKDEIKNYADQMGLLGSDAEYDSLYSDIIEAAENPELVKQTGVLETISAQIAALAVTDSAAQGKTQEELNKANAEMLGGKGVDTDAQAFAYGKKLVKDENGNIIRDKNGNAKLENLSAGEYEETKKSMQAIADGYKETAAIAAAKAKVATGEDKKYWEGVQANAEEGAARADKYIRMAAKARKEQAEQEKKEAEGRAKETKARNEARNKEQDAQKVTEEEKRKKQEKKAKENVEAENEKYKNRENPVDSEQVASGTNTEAQQQLQTMMSEGFNNLFSSIDPQQMMTPEVASAIGTLYDTFLTQGAQQATPEIEQALSTLGISLEDAIAAGLILDSSNLTNTAETEYNGLSDGVTKTANDATDIIADSAKTAADAAAEANNGLGTLSTGIAQSVTNFASNINKITLPTLQSPETSQSPKIGTPITKGAGVVAQIAQDAAKESQAKFTVDTEDGEAKLDNLQTKTDSVASIINQGATFVINVPGTEKLDKAARQATKITNAAGDQKINVTATTSGNSDEINSLTGAVKKFKDLGGGKTIKLKTTLSGASTSSIESQIAAINAFHLKTDHTVTLKTIKETVNKKAIGAHNHGYAPAPPSLGSAARGSYGQVGPKGKGGLTLTGELGYEIAWLPDENRSMILGANGPQMVDLPGNAVVWTHEQSKRIMKQKAIPAGSHAYVSADASTYKKKSTTTSNSSTTIKRTNTSGTDKYIKNTSKKVEKAAEESAKSIKRVSVWWENIARQTEATQRKMDKNAKSFEDYLKKTNITLKSVGSTGKGDDYIKNIGQYIGYNQAQVDRANKELAQLASGKWQSGKKKGKAATSKKTKKKKKKTNQIAYEQGADNIVQISYKKGKKEKTSYINLAKFIKKDSTGAYVVSQKELNAVKGSDKRKAIADAANTEIDNRLSKKYKAEDAIEKAREALDKMGQDLYDTFFGWKNELTEIWRITQKIEQAEARIAQSKEYKSLLDAQLESGQKTAEEISAQRIKAYQNEIKQETELLLEKASSIKEKKQAVVDAYSLDDEVKTLNAVTAKLNKSKTAQKNITNAEKEVKNSKAQVSLLRNKLTNLLQYRNVKTVSTTKNGMEHGMMHKERVGTDKQIAQTAKELASAEKRLSAANKNLTNAKKANESTILNETARTGYEAYAKQLISDIKTQQLASKYTKLSQNADGTYNIDFNAEQLKTDKENAKITTTQYEKVKEYIEHIKETNDDLVETYKDITSGLADMQSRVATLDQEWADYAEQLWDISEKEESERIDELKTLSSSINDALKKLLDQIKKKLDERRKQEDNAKTERDISQKQQRLAMLQADTSGGHQVEIAQLQQEIADAQQNYQRNLEDQLLEKLQQQADEAAEQRERMIELEEQIKDATNNAALVDYWMGILSNPDSTADEIASVKQAIYDTYMKINKADQKPQPLVNKLKEEVNVLIDGLLHNRGEKKEVENAITTLTKGENAPLTLIENSINAIGAFLEKNLPEFTPNADIKEETDKAVGKANDATKKTGSSGSKKTTTNNTKQKQEYQSKIKAAQKNKKIGGKEFAEVQKKASAAGIHARTYMADLAKTSGLTWEQVIRAAEAKPNKFNKYRIVLSFNSDSFIKGYEKVHGKGSYKKDLKIAKDKKYKPYEYATGGLADYTGPAWLDGTPSKPELVLNAQDTKNFIALKDVLSKALGSAGSVENTYGNATYEININVDHLNNDYDVDKVVERVKKKIVQDSSYRNVTQVRNFR